MDGATERVHATAIAAGGRAALIFGLSGSGKSDLALRCLSLSASSLITVPIQLIADDQVLLVRTGNTILASAPAPLLGKLEVRGIGILSVEAGPATEVKLAVEQIGRAHV